MGRKAPALHLIILSVFITGLCCVFWSIFCKTEYVVANLALQEQMKVNELSLSSPVSDSALMIKMEHQLHIGPELRIAELYKKSRLKPFKSVD